MENTKIIIKTFKNNKVFGHVIRILKMEYKIKEQKGNDLKIYHIEIPEDFTPEQWKEFIFRSIHNIITKMPKNYLFYIGSGIELGFIGSFSIELEGHDTIYYSHKIKEVKKVHPIL